MLGKLLKYDLKWIYKVVVIYYIIGIGTALIGRIFNSIDNSAICSIIGKIVCGVAVSMLVSSLFNCVIRSWVRFVQNVYKDESYLTHTLPVTSNQIYISKVISSIIANFTTVIVIFVGMFICYYSEQTLEFIKTSLQIASDVYDVTVVGIIVCVVIIFFLEVIFLVLDGYLGIIIGHRFNKNKTLLSIVIAIVLYNVMGFISLGLIFILGTVEPSAMNLINTKGVVEIGTIKLFIGLGMILYAAYCAVLFFISRWQLNKGVNVD